MMQDNYRSLYDIYILINDISRVVSQLIVKQKIMHSIEAMHSRDGPTARIV